MVLVVAIAQPRSTVAYAHWGYIGCMPKVSVYLPDELHRAVQQHDLPLSAMTQAAVRAAVRDAERHQWVARMRARPRRRTGDFDTTTLMGDVREDLGW
jgi:post-segregation antitoxin (ccd killing protein)